MTESDDPAEAAERLEHALDRIAALAAHRPAPVSAPSGADASEIAARLDALIARVRGALDAPAG